MPLALIVTGKVKGLLAMGGLVIGFEPERWPASRKRPPDYSPHANVRRVFPGAVVHVSADLEVREERRAPLEYLPATILETDARQARLEEALLESAREIAACEGPWGAFVSGGIDSSLAAPKSSTLSWPSSEI
jgi:asparagine synthetase B (glutamine-hydrolysing)